MGILNNALDLVLTACSVATIKENHTEPKERAERTAQRERRKNISDARNMAYLIKRFIH